MTAHAAEAPEPDGHGWPSRPSSLDDRRADRKLKSHRWTRWQREVKRLDWLPRSKTLRQLIDELVYRADNETGEWRLYLSELAEAMGASVRTVSRRMRDLADLGLIEYKPGRSNPKTKSWFRLIPLDEVGATGCHPRGDSVSPQPDGQTGIPGATPSHPMGDTMSPLTAVGTTNGTGPPQPPEGGSSHAPIKPPGARQRDTARWRVDVDHWAIAQGLPAEHLEHVWGAVQSGRTDRASIVAYLERWTDWRDGDSPPAAADAPLAGGEERNAQLTLGEGW